DSTASTANEITTLLQNNSIDDAIDEQPISGVNENQLLVIGQSSYTKHELSVLRFTSIINGRTYVPFLSIDLKERFAYTSVFNDPDGLLQLSSKQREHFHRFARLSEIAEAPKIIKS